MWHWTSRKPQNRWRGKVGGALGLIGFNDVESRNSLADRYEPYVLCVVNWYIHCAKLRYLLLIGHVWRSVHRNQEYHCSWGKPRTDSRLELKRFYQPGPIDSSNPDRLRRHPRRIAEVRLWNFVGRHDLPLQFSTLLVATKMRQKKLLWLFKVFVKRLEQCRLVQIPEKQTSFEQRRGRKEEALESTLYISKQWEIIWKRICNTKKDSD